MKGALETYFSEIPEADLEVMVSSVELRTYQDRGILAVQGEKGEEAFFILDGEVEVLVDKGPIRRHLGLRGAGEIVGEMAVLEERPRVATLIATRPTRVLALGRDRFLHLIADRPDLGMAVIRVLSIRMRKSLEQYMEDLLHKVQCLEDLNKDLEQKVQERTSKLEVANASLSALAAQDAKLAGRDRIVTD